MIYDGACAFCVRCVSLIERWDAHGRVRAVPFQDQAAVARVSPLRHAALAAAMHLVSPNGRVFAGAAAAPPLLRLLRWGRLVGWLFSVPGVPRAADLVYRAIARRRHRLGCGSPVCRRGDRWTGAG